MHQMQPLYLPLVDRCLDISRAILCPALVQITAVRAVQRIACTSRLTFDYITQAKRILSLYCSEGRHELRLLRDWGGSPQFSAPVVDKRAPIVNLMCSRLFPLFLIQGNYSIIVLISAARLRESRVSLYLATRKSAMARNLEGMKDHRHWETIPLAKRRPGKLLLAFALIEHFAQSSHG